MDQIQDFNPKWVYLVNVLDFELNYTMDGFQDDPFGPQMQQQNCNIDPFNPFLPKLCKLLDLINYDP